MLINPNLTLFMKKLEYILTVDEDDNITGIEEKNKCHEKNGILHRGFVVIVLDSKDNILLAKRSRKKKLWPGFWDGSIASHVHKNETYEEAGKRRILQELGVRCKRIEFLFKIRYKASFKNLGTENEVCGVMVAKPIDEVYPNKEEISEYKFVGMDELKKDLKRNPKKYTPWFLLIFNKFFRIWTTRAFSSL